MSTQSNLSLESKPTGPVECLGQEFPSDEARREHYLALLAEKLKDPEFRKIEGFPIGEDEDILALSDPPYYTACPNPWIGEFIEHYGRPYDPKEKYHREPFAADVSEGKNHPIYNAHSYHTKVPHRAIMRYILHYTEPGDVVFDGFCGTGMTGVAAQLCGDRMEVQELGYRVDDEGVIFDETGKPFSKLGKRKAVMNDLSPAATFITSTYNGSPSSSELIQEASEALDKCERELGGSYETLHPKDGGVGVINYTVWSDIFLCGECGADLKFWDLAVDLESGSVKDSFVCPECATQLTKRTIKPKIVATYDSIIGKSIHQVSQYPAFSIYTYQGKRYEKSPDSEDISRAGIGPKAEHLVSVPVEAVPKGDKTGEPIRAGLTHLHHFYTGRNLAVITMLRHESGRSWAPFSALTPRATRMHRIAASRLGGPKKGEGGATVGIINGTLYIPSLSVEMNVVEQARDRLKAFKKGLVCEVGNLTSTESTTSLTSLPDCSLDYVFIDPPFGANLMYSELNFLWEGWLGIKTSAKNEAIENKTQKKSGVEYKRLMAECFQQIYRCLKPGRWVTVEFSNTQASVWNSIQSALQEVGFVVANVAALDKKQGSFNAVTNTTSVKQDLVISAYKPNGGLEARFEKTGHTVEGVWDFIKTHLRNLPVVKPRGGELEFIAERDPRILYDRMIAFYIGHGIPVPLSSAEFQAALAEKFPEREGMFFLAEQVAEWDKKRGQMQGVGQMSIFVEDEKSAVDWLRNFLKNRPSIYSDIQPDFFQAKKEVSWKKWEKECDLAYLLKEYFLQYDGKGEVPSQIHSYLSTQNKDLRNLPKDDARLQARAKDRWFVPDPAKAVDVEAIRNKRLMQEFWELCDASGISKPSPNNPNQPTLPLAIPVAAKKTGRKKLKEVRTEAVRLGFKECFAAKDYATILALSATLPANVIEEDEQLQMIHDMAAMRAEG
jgi:DNA modification methylase